MSWLNVNDTSKALGLTKDSIWKLGSRGKLERKKINGKWHFNCSNSVINAFSKAEATEQVKSDILEREERSYLFDEKTNVYLFFGLPNQPPVVRVKSDVVESIVLDYSNEGGKKTVAQIALSYKLSRPTVVGILKALGKTHDSSPFTDELIESESEDQLVSSLLKIKEANVIAKAEQKRWRSEARLLEDRDFVKWSIDQAILSRPMEPLAVTPKTPNSDFCAVIGLTDLHIGKRGVDGYNSHEACRRALSAINCTTTEALKMWGEPHTWVLMCGSDMMNYDKNDATTTKGTPQDTDVSPREMLSMAYRLVERVVLHLAESGRVKIVCVSGNHDRLMSMSLGLMLEARFEELETVSVSLGVDESVYFRFGKSLLGFNHGDRVKPHALPSLMASERARDWGECVGGWEWFTGHRHTLAVNVNEYNGCRVWTLPSLSGTDRWHQSMGYVGNRKELAVFKVGLRNGVESLLFAKHESIAP